MTIIEMITDVDALKPNGYEQPYKVQWLSQLDLRVKQDIIDTHEGGEDVHFSGYTDDTPIDTELLIPHPYNDVYRYWLEAQIDYANGEYTKYNNSMSMFNTAYSAFERYYNRTHMPKGNKLKFF
jgi:hypothetical protein